MLGRFQVQLGLNSGALASQILSVEWQGLGVDYLDGYADRLRGSPAPTWSAPPALPAPRPPAPGLAGTRRGRARLSLSGPGPRRGARGSAARRCPRSRPPRRPVGQEARRPPGHAHAGRRAGQQHGAGISVVPWLNSASRSKTGTTMSAVLAACTTSSLRRQRSASLCGSGRPRPARAGGRADRTCRSPCATETGRPSRRTATSGLTRRWHSSSPGQPAASAEVGRAATGPASRPARLPSRPAAGPGTGAAPRCRRRPGRPPWGP